MSYTKDMVAAIQTAEPLTFEKAQELAATDAFVRAGKTTRSVVAKAKSLNVAYIPKAKPEPKGKDSGPTKAELLAQVRASLGLPADRTGDLVKAELEALAAAL